MSGDEKVSLNWELLEEAPHRDMQSFVRGLLQLYKTHPALYRQDNDWNGFEWINVDDADRSIFSFIRRDETLKKSLVFVVNFTPIAREDYRVGVPHAGSYRLILDESEGLYAESGSAQVPIAQSRASAISVRSIWSLLFRLTVCACSSLTRRRKSRTQRSRQRRRPRP